MRDRTAPLATLTTLNVPDLRWTVHATPSKVHKYNENFDVLSPEGVGIMATPIRRQEVVEALPETFLRH